MVNNCTKFVKVYANVACASCLGVAGANMVTTFAKNKTGDYNIRMINNYPVWYFYLIAKSVYVSWFWPHTITIYKRAFDTTHLALTASCVMNVDYKNFKNDYHNCFVSSILQNKNEKALIIF